MEKEQWEIDLRSQIDGIDEYQNMVDFIRPLIQQIRQDTIKEMESNLFLKDIVTKTRIDTLRQVLPDDEFVEWQDDLEYYGGDISINDAKKGFNLCIEKIENKAKEIWGIELNN